MVSGYSVMSSRHERADVRQWWYSIVIEGIAKFTSLSRYWAVATVASWVSRQEGHGHPRGYCHGGATLGLFDLNKLNLALMFVLGAAEGLRRGGCREVSCSFESLELRCA